MPEQVDAAMAGRIYISGYTPRSSWVKNAMSKPRSYKRYRSRYGRGRGRGRNQNRRKSRSIWQFLSSSEETGLGAYNYDNYEMDWLVLGTCEPIQSVYFFSGGRSPCHPCSWSSCGPPCCPRFP